MCAGIYKNTTFTQLVEIVYTVTRIDKTKYDITIHFVTEHSSDLSATKFPIKDDYGVRFIMCDDRKYKVMYVDMICKDVGVSNLRSDGNQDSGVAIPFTSGYSPLQNNDFGTYGMVGLSDDASHTDDDCDNETDDNNDDSDGDNSGGGDEKEINLEYPKVRFLGSQFEDNHL